MIKRIVVLSSILLLVGCETARDYAELVYRGARRQELVFVASPCGGHHGQPFMVSAWLTQEQIKRAAVIICKPDCTACRIEVRK